MMDVLDFVKTRLDQDHFEKFVYAFESGKRVRPRLMEGVCAALGKDFRPLVPAASAIEAMHCVSLVHDDIVDKSLARRSRPSFHAKFGTDSAVLHGDLFAILALELVA